MSSQSWQTTPSMPLPTPPSINRVDRNVFISSCTLRMRGNVLPQVMCGLFLMVESRSFVSRAMLGTLDAAATNAPVPLGFQRKSRDPESNPGVIEVDRLHVSHKNRTARRIEVPLPFP